MTNDEPPGAGAGRLSAVNGLIDAAAGGGRKLARRLCRELGAGSWAVVIDRFGGARHAEPQGATARAAGVAEGCRRLWERPGSMLVESGGDTVLLHTLVGDADLVLAVGVPGAMDADHRLLVNTTARLLRVIVAAARQQQQAEATLNGGILRLLVAGERETAAAVLAERGGLPAEPVRFYRGAVYGSPGAVLDLFSRAVGSEGVTALSGDEVVMVVSAGSAADLWLRKAVPDMPGRRLFVGASDPAPLARSLAAYREAGHALRAGRAVGQSLTVFGELAEQRLTGLIPEPRLLGWAATLLRPLLEHDDERRLTEALYTWLKAHGRTATAAGELGIDRKTLERRVRLSGELLDVDLRDECVRVRLHLALHALDRAAYRPPYGPDPLRAERDCLVWLLDIDKSLEWAAAVTKPFSEADTNGQLRRTLRVWLERHGDNQGTAEELGVHRNTVAKRLSRIESLTGQNLDYVGNRAELYLALLTDDHARAGTLPPEAYETAPRLADADRAVVAL